ncbi:MULTISPECIES: helix-turn-helix domain-containing protein [Mesorhizobium]|uniref:helix-turn-helix domain-containing protein n=1 Tax=Mesorhizobium TaxID=68287 RepID=UPI0010A95A3B|nr:MULTISPECIES: helix-turn-helix domain-containing protein [Mesorhizobium]
MSGPNYYLTPEEVVARYRGRLSEGTLRNWRCMRIGPSFLKIGKAILYPSSELDRWDKSILVVCRPTRKLPLEEASPLG